MLGSPVLTISHLSKYYRSSWFVRQFLALSDLSAEIYSGEIFGFLGPNGAGKTTTLKLVMGLLRPSQGHITFFGDQPPGRKSFSRTGFLPEQPYFYDHLTVEETLKMAAGLFSLEKQSSQSRIEELLQVVDLQKNKKDRLRYLSKGMLQRLGIAQALVNDPRLLVLDEPMSGLDPLGRKEVRDIILRLRDQGRAVFFSSHIIPDVEMICDRVGILVKGRLRKILAMADLMDTEADRRFEMTIRRAAPFLKDAIVRMGISMVDKGGVILARPATQRDVQTLLRLADKNGGEVLSLESVRVHLEEIFLKETLCSDE